MEKYEIIKTENKEYDWNTLNTEIEAREITKQPSAINEVYRDYSLEELKKKRMNMLIKK